MASTGEIRDWLRKNGYNPGARGRLHPDHIAAYEAKNGSVKAQENLGQESFKIISESATKAKSGDIEGITCRGLRSTGKCECKVYSPGKYSKHYESCSNCGDTKQTHNLPKKEEVTTA